MKRFLLMTAFGLALPSVALCAPQPWAQITDFWFGGGGTITLARDGQGPEAHWIAVNRSLIVVSEVIEKYRWTESRACPGLDRIVEALGPLRTMKRSKPRLEGPRDGEFAVRFLADGKQPLKVLGGKGHGAEE